MPDDFSTPHADRPPTAEEKAAAELGATKVDLDEVSGHYEAAVKLGANVRGEGEIAPRPDRTPSDEPHDSDEAAGDEGIDEQAEED